MAAPLDEFGTVPNNELEVVDNVPNTLDLIEQAIKAQFGTYQKPMGTGWRIEVIQRGKGYIWRKGRAHERESAPGGRFIELSPERQAAYYANIERREAIATAKARNIAAGVQRLPRHRGPRGRTATG